MYQEARITPNHHMYICTLRRLGVHSKKQLAVHMTAVTGRPVGEDTIKAWEKFGWPAPRWNELLKTLGITHATAKKYMFEKQPIPTIGG